MSIFSVSLGIRSESLTPAELSSYAGAQPTTAHANGDRVSPRLPAPKVWTASLWQKDSGVTLDSWTLEPHWPALAPILESIANTPSDKVEATLSIGVNARSLGFAFDITPEQIALLSRARCGIWIDSYPPNRDHADLPDDYPYPEVGTLSRPGVTRKMLRRMNVGLRNVNPFGKVRRHRRKLEL